MTVNANGSKIAISNTPSLSQDFKDTATQPKYRLCLNGFTLVSGGKVWVMEKA